jgi:hypothetical protein
MLQHDNAASMTDTRIPCRLAVRKNKKILSVAWLKSKLGDIKNGSLGNSMSR